MTGYGPHAVLLVQEKGNGALLEIAQRIYQGFPGCALVMLTAEMDLAAMQGAMQAGIRQVVDMKNPGQVRTALIQAAVFEKGRAQETGRDSRVISFYAGRGGVGRTTLAVNLGVSLAQSGNRTALIDLCLHYGDASLLLNITAKDTLSELVQERSDFTMDDIRSFCMQHSSGLCLLSSPSSPEYAEYVTARHVETLVNLMRPYYDYILLDLPMEMSDNTVAAMENADDILLVCHPDLTNLRSAKMTLGILSALQQHDKVLLTMNADRKGLVTANDFIQVLEKPVSFSLPEDVRTTRLSQERGVPFVIGMPRSPMAQGIQRMTRYFAHRDWQGAGA